MSEERYRVEVVCFETDKVVAVIGRGLSLQQAERQIETGLTQFDLERVYIREVKE
jgi:hypothetical protein